MNGDAQDKHQNDAGGPQKPKARPKGRKVGQEAEKARKGQEAVLARLLDGLFGGGKGLDAAQCATILGIVAGGLAAISSPETARRALQKVMSDERVWQVIARTPIIMDLFIKEQGGLDALVERVAKGG
jgi:hypothetical protein